MQHSKSLHKVDAQTSVALEAYQRLNPRDKFKTDLDIDPNMASKESALLTITAVPLATAGFIGPMLLEYQAGIIIPGAEPLGYIMALLVISGVFATASFQKSKIIKSAFKYSLGHKLRRGKVKELRFIQKSLRPGETKLVPASDVFEEKDILDFTVAKGLELDILISEQRVSLQWGKPLGTSELWDETVDDMVSLFDLETSDTEQRQLAPSFTRKIAIKMSQSA